MSDLWLLLLVVPGGAALVITLWKHAAYKRAARLHLEAQLDIADDLERFERNSGTDTFEAELEQAIKDFKNKGEST